MNENTRIALIEADLRLLSQNQLTMVKKINGLCRAIEKLQPKKEEEKEIENNAKSNDDV
jgi:aspartate oxidase